MSDDRFRALKAVLRTTLLWGVACGVAGGGIAALMALLDPAPGIEALPERVGGAFFALAAWGIRFAIWGGVVGMLFAGVIRFGFRGRRIAEFNVLRFAFLGALVGAIGVPLGLQFLNVVFGDGLMAWHLVTDDAVWASVFGASAAAGSIWMARRAAALPGEKKPATLGAPDPFEEPAALRESERSIIEPRN